MPSGAMGNSGGGSDVRRFGPTDSGPGELPSTVWEPGVVEVQFVDGVGPEVAESATSPAESLRSATGVDLTDFVRIVQSHGLGRAESTFETPAQEADAVQESARLQGEDLPNLRSFVTLHFADAADTPSIARELQELDVVVRAVPVPMASPPRTPLAEPPVRAIDQVTDREAAIPVPSPPVPLDEPLVGSSDQVIVDPNTGLQNQWYVFRCRADRAWNMSSGAGVVVADIDWGYRTTHQDLASRLDMTRAFNSVDGGTNVSFGSDTDHGTGVMGLAGAADNNLGMAGIAWGASLWPVQANAAPGPSLGGNSWARAIDWVRTTSSGGRRKVIILEVQTSPALGNYEQVPSVNAAIRTAIASGVVVCVAAGNGNRDAGLDDSGNPIQPTGSILVGATNFHPTQNPRAGFSNWGPQVVVAAPGDGSNDLTCGIGSDSNYRNGFGGTSGATPKVAATAALMLSVAPSLTHQQIRSILNSTGGPVVTAAGRPVGTFLNCEAAVRQAKRATRRIEVIARGADRAIWHNSQTTPGGAWSGWSSLGGWVDLVDVGSNADGRLEVFARGADGAVWNNWQTTPGGAWSGWNSLGGWVDRLTVGSNADGRLEVFARGADGAVWNNWQTAPNNGWSGWSSLGGWVDLVDVGSNADGRLEVFARGADGAVWNNWQTAPNNGWSGWNSLGGWVDRLTVGSNADGRLEVFARGADGAVWNNWQTAPNNGWSGWSSLGGWVDLLDVGSNADGRLEVFARGADGAVWNNWQTAPGGSWSGWNSLGGWVDRLTVGSNADGRLEVFARGADGAVWNNWQTAPNNGWSGWNSLGGWVDLLAVGSNAR